jgi:hypothetical protein
MRAGAGDAGREEVDMTEQRQRMLVDGLVAGVIGYVTVALFFMVLNVVTGRALLSTASVLGAALLGGSGESVELALAFNGLHLVAFLGLGYFAAWLVYETGLHPQLWYVALALFVGGTLFGFTALVAVTVLSGGGVPAWLVVASSLVGVLAMGSYFLLRHRPLVLPAEEGTPGGGSQAG